MTLQLLWEVEKGQTKFTNVKTLTVVVVAWIRRVIPRLWEMLTHLNLLYSLELRSLLMCQQGRMVHTFVFSVLVVLFLLCFCSLLLRMVFLNYLLACLSDLTVTNPLVVSTVQRLVVNVVLVTVLTLWFCCVVVWVISLFIQKRKIKDIHFIIIWSTQFLCLKKNLPFDSRQSSILALYHLLT